MHWYITAGMCIDHASVENGYIEVATGWHKKGLLGAEWKPLEGTALPYCCIQCLPGDVMIFNSYIPHWSSINNSTEPHRTIPLKYNLERDGGKLNQYYRDKRRDFPPDIERLRGKKYIFQV